MTDCPIIFTDDAWIMGVEPPVTPEIIRERMIEPLKGMSAALWWSVGDHEVYHHETAIGERMGDGYDPSELLESSRRKAENLRYLTANHGGPLTVLSSLCREAGIEFLPRVRMNSHYAYLGPPDIDHYAPEYGRYRQDNPHLLIGRPGEEIPEGTIEWDIRTGKDFAHPEVREYMYSIIAETFERFDVDGVEMDFNRHPGVFRREEACENRHLMTDLLRRVRGRLDETGAERGRRMQLAVRVPPTLSRCENLGLDVRCWMSEGLVDTVVAGVGWIPFEIPIREFVVAAEGTGCQVYGCLEALRPLFEDEPLKGAAYRHWQAGVDGIYLYNYYTMPPQWIRRMLPQLADREGLATATKRYEADHADRIAYPGHGGAFRNAVPPAQLPIALRQTPGQSWPAVFIDVPDKVETAAAAGTLGKCVVSLTIEGNGPNDEIDVVLNGTVLSWSSGRTFTTGGGPKWPTMHADVGLQHDLEAPPLKSGRNELEVRHRSGDPSDGSIPRLTNVEITVSHADAQR